MTTPKDGKPSLLDRVKSALRAGIEPKQIAAIYGVSEFMVLKVKTRLDEQAIDEAKTCL